MTTNLEATSACTSAYQVQIAQIKQLCTVRLGIMTVTERLLQLAQSCSAVYTQVDVTSCETGNRFFLKGYFSLHSPPQSMSLRFTHRWMLHRVKPELP